ncbi:GntR family transcriptional regulator [Leisingera methylohalidivorans]|uniref:GntR family transcriptional regulator n=1 Tax=Leisingera methylohalidivorans DSM 14336 TaxID=999552 RepID=V9VX03_9RHOB|nr:GntR family transcriptional regulator [Leisingera methylohalidivorans]AHD02483.1 GntR family transcriptional regulator [Leisingera methylohalidivorans DSM 14336]
MTDKPRHSWVTIRDRIREMILNSTYGPGDKLPRDEEFAGRFGCARSTVHRAMQDLAQNGLVQRRRKGGTTVQRDPVTRATLNIPITRLEVEQKGSVYRYQLIRQSMQPPSAAILANFGLHEARPMLRVEALHLADSRPYIFEDRWICLETVPEIKDVDLTRESANEWLVRNRPYSRCDLRLYARRGTKSDSEILQSDVGNALFVMERTTWIGDAPITSLRAVAHPGYQLFTQG